jgi:hypothetical protein
MKKIDPKILCQLISDTFQTEAITEHRFGAELAGGSGKGLTNVRVSPLSVNECWQGKRFKTPKYKAYEIQVLELLPPMEIPAPPYSIYFEFGFSNSLSDIDNPVKPVQDILQKKYGFNDRHIMEMQVVKRIVKKGSESFAFEIKQLITI